MKRLVAATVLGLLLLAQAAEAHPLGNFTVNRYSRLEVAFDRIALRYVLDLAEIPTLQELNAAGIEPSRFGAERAALLEAMASRVSAGAQLRLDGRPVAWSRRSASLELLPGQAGLSTLRLALTLDAPGAPDGARVEYRDRNYPGRVGWHEVVLRGLGGVRLDGSTAPAADTTNELRSYPTDPATPPLDRNEALATVRTGAPAAPDRPIPSTAGQARFGLDRSIDHLTGFLRTGAGQEPAALLVALLAAAALGALHALGPGHGKAIAAAYLVGARGTAAQAILLGLTVTVTHTIGVFALGAVTLLAAQHVLPEHLYPLLTIASGLAVVAVGVVLLGTRLRSLTHGHEHAHEHRAAEGRGLVALGVSGGLLPCPTALVVLLAAISFREVALGLALVVAFSAGLASVLTGIGLLVVLGRRWLRANAIAPRLAGSRLARALPIASATAISLAGVAIAIEAARALV